MNSKTVVSVFIVVIVVIFAYYIFILPQSPSARTPYGPQETELIEGVTLYKTVTGTIVGVNKEVISLSTSEGVLSLKKMEATRYLVLHDGITTPVDERILNFQINEQARIIAGIDESKNKITALSVFILK